MKYRQYLSALLSVLLLPFLGTAQIADPVDWKFNYVETAPGTYELRFSATVENGWYLYSHDIEAGGPIPTNVIIDDESGLAVGEIKEEGDLIVDYEEVFNMDVGYYFHNAVFSRTITVEAERDEVSGFVEYMACDGEQCTPPLEFEFAFHPESIAEESASADKQAEESRDASGWAMEGNDQDQDNAAGGLVDPVQWSFEIEKEGDHIFSVFFTAEVEEGWYIYAPDIDAGGPIPTSIIAHDGMSFSATEDIVYHDDPESGYDEVFEMDIRYFRNQVTFSRLFTLHEDAGEFSGFVEYMACDDEMCTPPLEAEFTLAVPEGVTPSGEKAQKAESTPASAPPAEESNFLAVFIGGILGGLLALLTPCVFPMIMLTVSFFTNRQGGSTKGIIDAGMYGASIVIIYVLFGFFITLLLGPNTIQAIASNPWVNLTFFTVFVIFAMSFFGAFDIQLPNSWANKFDSHSNRGGFIGIFFMALTLVIVSFSCTGPILGTLLIEAAVSGGQMGPLIGIAGFSMAFAIPYVVFAIFPTLVEKLPKSGGWMNTIKVVLGFLILALSLKFLSNASRVAHWGILSREVFIVLWIVLFVMLGFYLLGKLRFAHDSEVKYVTVPRLFFSIICFGFAIYLVPGMWGAPLKVVSGWLPPETSQEFNLTRYMGGSQGGGADEYAVIMSERKYSDRLQCHHNIPCFFDYHEAVAYANEKNKPLLLDFTGHSCVNCDIMHSRVWSNQGVQQRLKDDFVLVQLYVDDRTSMPDDSEYRYLGQKWRDFQVERFTTNTLPYYVIIDPDENVLNEPRGYNTDISAYTRWLDEGLMNFSQGVNRQTMN